jgi:hypothetical protein
MVNDVDIGLTNICINVYGSGQSKGQIHASNIQKIILSFSKFKFKKIKKFWKYIINNPSKNSFLQGFCCQWCKATQKLANSPSKADWNMHSTAMQFIMASIWCWWFVCLSTWFHMASAWICGWIRICTNEFFTSENISFNFKIFYIILATDWNELFREKLVNFIEIIKNMTRK